MIKTFEPFDSSYLGQAVSTMSFSKWNKRMVSYSITIYFVSL